MANFLAVQQRAGGVSPTICIRVVGARANQVLDEIGERIALYFGPRMARAALTAAQQKVGGAVEDLELRDVPLLLAAIRPMLATFLGQSQCDLELRRIQQKFGL